jgi:hypothetical protein
MQNSEGEIRAIYYEKAGPAGALRCAPGLIPAPGQYTMAAAVPGEGQAGEVLATPLFFSGHAPEGFAFAGPIPATWRPGMHLALRGPLGHGFHLPLSARRVALLGYNGPATRLLGLVREALAQEAEVALVCESAPADLPEDVEVQPLKAMDDLCEWAGFIAVEVERDSLPELIGRLRANHLHADTQVLVAAPMPCGAMAECGVCAVTVRGGWKMVCKDGPVFDLREIGESAGGVR